MPTKTEAAKNKKKSSLGEACHKRLGKEIQRITEGAACSWPPVKSEEDSHKQIWADLDPGIALDIPAAWGDGGMYGAHTTAAQPHSMLSSHVY